MASGKKEKNLGIKAIAPDGEIVNIIADEYGQLKVVVLGTAQVQNTASSATIGDVTMKPTATTSPSKAEDAVHATGDVGIANLGVRIDAATSQTSASGDYGMQRVNAYGDQTFVPGNAVAATVTGVASAATSATLIAANTSRKGLLIHNNSTAILYIRFSATAAAATSGNYTTAIVAQGYYEMPNPVYTGAITAIWAAANGFANVTELT